MNVFFIILATIGAAVLIVMILLLLNEAILASDCNVTIYGGRGFKEAVNPIKFIQRMKEGYQGQLVFIWLTLTPVWGFPLFILLYSICRFIRRFDKNPKNDYDYISIKVVEK